MTYNKLRLGGDWFEQGITEDAVRQLIHEFAHEFSGDHLTSQHHEALCWGGAKMFLLGWGETGMSG